MLMISVECKFEACKNFFIFSRMLRIYFPAATAIAVAICVQLKQNCFYYDMQIRFLHSSSSFSRESTTTTPLPAYESWNNIALRKGGQNSPIYKGWKPCKLSMVFTPDCSHCSHCSLCKIWRESRHGIMVTDNLYKLYHTFPTIRRAILYTWKLIFGYHFFECLKRKRK